MNRMNRRATVIVAAAATVPLLAGCFNGFNAQTDTQGPSGDGTSTEIGNIQIRSANWVRSSKNPQILTLVTTFVNQGKQPDVLQSVTTDPKAFVVGITGGQLLLKPISEVRTGYNSDLYINGYGVDAAISGYVPTTFNFKNAGTVQASVLTVPPTGIYEGIAPVPSGFGAKAEPSKAAKPSASASASASASPSPSKS